MSPTEFAAQILRFSTSMAKSRDAGDEFGALILFYAYTDALGSLLRPKGERKTSSVYFKRYVQEFILTDASLPISADDLWGARCGMLHTFSPYSDLTEGENPRARKVIYVKSNRQAEFSNKVIGAKRPDLVFVDSFELFNAFVDGAVAFGRKVLMDPAFADSVLFHAENFLQEYRVRVPNHVSQPTPDS